MSRDPMGECIILLKLKIQHIPSTMPFGFLFCVMNKDLWDREKMYLILCLIYVSDIARNEKNLEWVLPWHAQVCSSSKARLN